MEGQGPAPATQGPEGRRLKTPPETAGKILEMKPQTPFPPDGNKEKEKRRFNKKLIIYITVIIIFFVLGLIVGAATAIYLPK